MSSRIPPRHELLNERSYQPRLLLSDEIAVPPQEGATDERARAAQAWRALQAAPEDILRDQRELDKLDRALVEARRQAHAARSEAQEARAKLAAGRNESYPPAVTWGLGGLAVLAVAGWFHQRRQLLDAQHQSLLAPRYEPQVDIAPTVSAEPAEAADPLPEGEDAELRVRGGEADPWIERVTTGDATAQDPAPPAQEASSQPQ